MNYLRRMSLTVMAVIGLQQTTLEALSPKKVVGLGCILASCTYWCVQQVYKHYNSTRKTIVESHDVLSEEETPVETVNRESEETPVETVKQESEETHVENVNRESEETPVETVKQESMVLVEKPMQAKKSSTSMDSIYIDPRYNALDEDDLSHFNASSSKATRKRAQEIKLGISHPYESF